MSNKGLHSEKLPKTKLLPINPSDPETLKCWDHINQRKEQNTHIDKQPNKIEVLQDGLKSKLAKNDNYLSLSPIPKRNKNAAADHFLKNHIIVNKTKNTTNIEENICKEKYYTTLEQPGAFHKTLGYFTEFASRNKKLCDQYKLQRLPSSGHSRYTSKPVMFTSLETRNKFCKTGTFDHSELLQSNKKALNSSFQSRLKQSMSLNDAKKATTSTSFGPFLKSIEKQNTLKLERSVSPKSLNTSLSKFQTQADFEKRSDEENVKGNQRNILTRNSSVRLLKAKTLQHNKFKALINELSNPKSIPVIARYQTKEMTEIITNKSIDHSKIKPDQYLEHSLNKDYLRQTGIAISVKDKERKYLKKHSGIPEAYTTKPNYQNYREVPYFDEINKFENNMQSWRKSVPNFGKQRWTYKKDWEFKAILKS